MEVPEPLVPTQPRYTRHLNALVAPKLLDGDTRLDEDAILENREEELLLESGSPDLAEASSLPSEGTDLPLGWIACWDQRLHNLYYVHRGARIKTWKKPTDAIELYTPFPHMASRLGIDNFDPDVPPPLPDEFQVLACDDTPPTFEYPVSVHLVYSPIRGVQPIYRLMDAVQESCQKIAVSIYDHVMLGPYWWVYVILSSLFLLNCLGWIVVTVVMLFPLIWRLMSSLLFLPVVYILAAFFIRPLTRVPKAIMRDMLLVTSGTLGLSTLIRLGSDQAAWSHWKVLVGPYMYELVKVPREGLEPESTGNFLNLVDWVEMQVTSMSARNLISTISSEEDYSGNELPSDETEALLHESTLAKLQAEFPAIEFTPSPTSRRPPLRYSEERSRTTLAVAEITHQERTGNDSGDVCQCIRRHLTEEEYEDLHRKYRMVYIGKTEMSEQEGDEKAKSLMRSWPPYRTFDTNCQAFALSFLDALCSSNISTISSRMVLHFAWFVHLPNVLNIVLGIVICCSPTIMDGEKSNLEFFSRIDWAFMAFFMAYDFGWKAFTLLFNSRIGLAVDSRIQTYYMRAAGRPSRFSTAARERIVFYSFFLLYTFIHTGLFVSFLYYTTFYWITIVTVNELLIEATFWFWIEKGLKRKLPCSALGISGTFALTPKSFVYLLKIWLVIAALFFLWPVIVVRIFSNPLNIGFPWIQDTVSNFADLRGFNEKHERLVALALEFNLTNTWNGYVEEVKANNGSLFDPWKLASVMRQSNLTDFIPPAACVVWGVASGTNSTLGHDGEL